MRRRTIRRTRRGTVGGPRGRPGGPAADCRGRPILAAVLPEGRDLQQDEPAGVPPLSLTGERTLPGVDAENYWYRRHLAIYEWIAARCSGLEVVDMACGEGYGSAVLAERAARVTGVDADPEAHEHAVRKYGGPGLYFVRERIERFAMPCDAVALLQTIEHLQEPEEALAHLRSLLRPGGVAYVSTPNAITLAPPGAGRSDNPWHVREYRAGEFRDLCERVFEHVELLGLFHTRKLRAHDLALSVGWDRLHRRLGLTGPFYERFIPAISVRDFALREGPLERALDFLAVLR